MLLWVPRAFSAARSDRCTWLGMTLRNPNKRHISALDPATVAAFGPTRGAARASFPDRSPRFVRELRALGGSFPQRFDYPGPQEDHEHGDVQGRLTDARLHPHEVVN